MRHDWRLEVDARGGAVDVLLDVGQGIQDGGDLQAHARFRTSDWHITEIDPSRR